MSIGYIVIMIRFIIIFTTRVKRFLHYFLRIVRVYPIDTANNPLHERETAQPGIHLGRAAVPPGRSYHRYECAAMQPGIHPGTHSRTAWAQLSPLRARSHAAEYSPRDAQPCSRIFALGRAAVPPGRSLSTPRCSAKINPARLLRAGYPAMK